MSITPDLIEWLLADQKVCQSWRGIATRLNFGCHLGSLDKHGGGDTGSLRLLLRLWSTAKPASYNVKGLKRVLAAEGLHHMWLWISLMTQKEGQPTPDSENYSQTLPNKKVNTSTPTPWSSYLYTFPSHKAGDFPSSSSLYPSTNGSSGPPSDYSRPNSRLSEYNTYSCPTTPTTPRKHLNIQTLGSKDTYSTSNDTRNKVKRAHSLRSSSGNEPKLAKLKSPRIVETEIWKKEIYKKVVEEVKEYNDGSKGQRNYRSGSLPNLAADKYTSKVEIQLWENTVKVPEKKRKQSEHEKEILQLCDDIIAEMKVNKPETIIPLKVDNGDDTIYDKISKRHDVNVNNEEPIYDKINKEPIYDRIHKNPSQKVNKQQIYRENDNVAMKDTVVKDMTETVDTYISVKEVKIVTENVEKDQISQNHGNSSHEPNKPQKKVLNKESSKEYFENLVNILEEAIKDISR